MGGWSGGLFLFLLYHCESVCKVACFWCKGVKELSTVNASLYISINKLRNNNLGLSLFTWILYVRSTGQAAEELINPTSSSQFPLKHGRHFWSVHIMAQLGRSGIRYASLLVIERPAHPATLIHSGVWFDWTRKAWSGPKSKVIKV